MTERPRNRTGWMVPATAALLATAVMFAMTGCASTSKVLPPGEGAVIDTGNTLDALGGLFKDAGVIFDNGKRAGTITEKQYDGWRTFAEHYKRTYPPLVDTWKALRDTPSAPDRQARATVLLNQVLALKNALLSLYMPASAPKAAHEDPAVVLRH